MDETYKKAVENGATSVLELEFEPWGCCLPVASSTDRAGRRDQRTCYVADPEGNLIEIGSWNKPFEEKDGEYKNE